MKAYLAVFVLLLATAAQAAEIKGKVVSATGGEPLRHVRVTLLENKAYTVSTDDGSFSISKLSPGTYTLQVAAVGYRLVNTAFVVAGESDIKNVSIALAPDNLPQTETVEVKGDIFQGENPAVPSQMTLNARELKEASTLLDKDPFRAVQSLPGVSAFANNDFFGEVWVRGSDLVGIYVDNVLVPEPFHAVFGLRGGPSLSVFSSETTQELTLMSVAYPMRFADVEGAALAITTREGSRTQPHFTLSAGVAESEFVAEGGLGNSGKGSWLASVRKSYLNYLYQHRVGDPSTDEGFEDASLKLNYDVARNHSVSLYFLGARTDLKNNVPQPDVNTQASGSNDFDLGRAGWRYAVTPRLLLDSEGAYIRQRADIRNPFNQVSASDYYGEWVGGTRAVWNWHKDHVLEAGYTGRRLKDSSYSTSFSPDGPLPFFVVNETGLRQTAYAQQASSFFNSRLHVMAGMRWDQMSQIDSQPLSAQASAAWQLASHTQLQFGFGRYTQFEDLRSIGIDCSFLLSPGQSPETLLLLRSKHYSAALEQRFGENTRVRVEGFDRQNQFSVGRRSLNQGGCGPVEPDPQFPRALDADHSRGVQIMVQRRSANRLSGWAGYTLNYSSQPSPITGSSLDPTAPTFDQPTFTDQRHTFNAFGMYRITPSINLSAKVLYGSGYPFNTFDFQPTATGVLNLVGFRRDVLGSYHRLDLRAAKAWAFKQSKMTLYAEGLNMTNHYNPRLLQVSFDPITSRASAITARGLPITPAAGVTFEF